MRQVLTLVALLALGTSSARAQDACAGGRIATAQGYCCWPGQRWDDADQRCEGPPRCPPPLSASGATCIGPGASVDEPAPSVPDMVRADGPVDYGSSQFGQPAPAVARSAPAAPQVAGALGDAWPSAGQVRPVGPLNPRHETRSQEDLQWGGFATFFAGYAVAVTLGGLELSVHRYGADDTTCYDVVGAGLFVPFIGGFITWGASDHCTVPVFRTAGGAEFHVGDQGVHEPGWAVAGVLTSVTQIIGGIIFMLGTTSSHEVTVFSQGHARLTVAPQLGPRTGLTATLTF